jgi:tRNA-dihydrouridine synthase B
MKEARKHTSWYLKGFRNAARYRERCNGLCNLEQFEELLGLIQNVGRDAHIAP